MLYALIAALIVTVAGHLWLLDRRDARDRDERQALLQRIQAPQMAVVAHDRETLPPDESSFPLSDREIAEQQERELALERIENLESGAAPWLQ